MLLNPKSNWQMRRVDRWAPACRAAGLDPVPRTYEYADVCVMPMSGEKGLLSAFFGVGMSA